MVSEQAAGGTGRSRSLQGRGLRLCRRAFGQDRDEAGWGGLGPDRRGKVADIEVLELGARGMEP